MSQAFITWYGHSCFSVELAGSTIVLDPYACGSVPCLRLPDLWADAIHVSHDHTDHNAAERVQRSGKPLNFCVREVAGTHDHHYGAHRGENRILVIEGDGLRIVHMGDQGCPLTPKQVSEIGQPDVLMLPIGGFFTINAREARDMMAALQPRVTIPMHYRDGNMGFDVLSQLSDFLTEDMNVVYARQNRLTITDHMPTQVIIPKVVQ